MRIALVSLEVSGFRGGGIGTYVVEAGHALSQAGHDVTLITSAPRRAEQREALRRLAEFTRVVFVEEVAQPARSARFAIAGDTIGFSYRACCALREQVERVHGGAPFDYVEFPDYEAAGYVTLLEQRHFASFDGTVFAVVLHSPTHECWQFNESLHAMPVSVREVAVLEHEAIEKAPVVWSPSTRLAEIVAERLSIAGPAVEGRDGTRVIRYPMRLSQPPPFRAEPATKLSELRFLYFGRIEPRKGVRQLVEAFAQLPELSIDCIGADRDSSPIGTSETRWLDRANVGNVRFLGAMPREQLLERLAAADVVVLPSTWDNWPNTCIESMAAGRVVIGGDHGGMGEMIEHGVSGFTCRSGDADDLARVIREDLAAAISRLGEIGAAAVERIRALSDPGTYVAAIERLVAEEQDRARPAPAPADGGALVSIVVPFYNEPLEMVGEAVDSAIAQTHEELEILVVEDGSPRADADRILADLAARDPRVCVLRKSNGGLASARNHAVGQARGDFLLFLDADNRLRDRYAADCLEAFARDPGIDAVVPWFETFGAKPRAGATVAALPFDLSLALVRNECGDAGAMFRAASFEKAQLRYDALVDVYSDWALWLDCAAKGLRVERVPRVLYDYRVRPGSMMDEQAWDRHVHLIGLLIERHLPVEDDRTRAMLMTLARAWGAGALLAAVGGRPEYADRSHLMIEGFRPGRVRYQFADALAKGASFVPGLRPLVRATLTRLVRAHGRYKDWRKGR